ncbi:MAG: hypothetical protein COA93_06040 [Alphaproteobacteria bacterium]|nr:MAG: hypothetical protein COA93_06040 [Alphaproteobacteria bacterium]
MDTYPTNAKFNSGNLMLNKLLIFIAALLLPATAYSEKVQQKKEAFLKDTPLSVMIPAGLILDTSVYTSYPAIFFSLPKEKEGYTQVYPRFNIEQLNHNEGMGNIKKLIRQKTHNLNMSIIEQPSEIIINGNKATEFVYQAEVIFDAANGTAARSFMTFHEIFFEYKSHIYVCSMEIYPKKYKKYLSKIEDLCNSIKFTN